MKDVLLVFGVTFIVLLYAFGTYLEIRARRKHVKVLLRAAIAAERSNFLLSEIARAENVVICPGHRAEARSEQEVVN